MKNKTIFVDIDTQFDFMNSCGNLYVPDAEDIIDNIKKLFDYAKEHKIKILSSTDAHKIDDPEFKLFPPHCIKGTPGSQKIDGTTRKDSIIFENKSQRITGTILNHDQIIVEKQSFDIFENTNTDKIVIQLNTNNYVVFGVATDYCVKDAVLGLIRRGYTVALVTDAIKATTEEREKEALKEMKNAGAVFTTTEETIAK